MENPQCSLENPQCSLENPQCSLENPQCSLENPQCSLENPQCSLENPQCSLENPQCHPIGYSSHALRDYKKRYVQIEKETPSTVFGVERFHEYLYGRKFTLINDHQPLKSIFSRSIVTCPPRIQKLFLRLQKYDSELEYAPGKTMLVSDALSRSYLNDIKPEFDENTLI